MKNHRFEVGVFLIRKNSQNKKSQKLSSMLVSFFVVLPWENQVFENSDEWG